MHRLVGDDKSDGHDIDLIRHRVYRHVVSESVLAAAATLVESAIIDEDAEAMVELRQICGHDARPLAANATTVNTDGGVSSVESRGCQLLRFLELIRAEGLESVMEGFLCNWWSSVTSGRSAAPEAAAPGENGAKQAETVQARRFARCMAAAQELVGSCTMVGVTALIHSSLLAKGRPGFFADMGGTVAAALVAHLAPNAFCRRFAMQLRGAIAAVPPETVVPLAWSTAVAAVQVGSKAGQHGDASEGCQALDGTFKWLQSLVQLDALQQLHVPCCSAALHALLMRLLPSAAAASGSGRSRASMVARRRDRAVAEAAAMDPQLRALAQLICRDESARLAVRVAMQLLAMLPAVTEHVVLAALRQAFSHCLPALLDALVQEILPPLAPAPLKLRLQTFREVESIASALAGRLQRHPAAASAGACGSDSASCRHAIGPGQPRAASEECIQMLLVVLRSSGVRLRRAATAAAGAVLALLQRCHAEACAEVPGGWQVDTAALQTLACGLCERCRDVDKAVRSAAIQALARAAEAGAYAAGEACPGVRGEGALALPQPVLRQLVQAALALAAHPDPACLPQLTSVLDAVSLAARSAAMPSPEVLLDQLGLPAGTSGTHHDVRAALANRLAAAR